MLGRPNFIRVDIKVGWRIVVYWLNHGSSLASVETHLEPASRILSDFEHQCRQKFCRVNRQLCMACNPTLGTGLQHPKPKYPTHSESTQFAGMTYYGKALFSGGFKLTGVHEPCPIRRSTVIAVRNNRSSVTGAAII